MNTAVLDPTEARGTPVWQQLAWGAGAILLLGLLWWLVTQLGSDSGTGKTRPPPPKVSILPDTPPPPPKEEPKKEPPKEEPKQVVQLNRPEPVPQQAPPPGPPQTKVDEAAGDGPSSLGTSGRVEHDGVPGGQGAGGAAPGDRQAYRFYARGLQGRLQADMERQLSTSDLPRLVVTVSLWVEPGGGCARYELSSAGRPEYEQQLKAAMDKSCAALRQPPPASLPQPIRMQLTIVPQGS